VHDAVLVGEDQLPQGEHTHPHTRPHRVEVRHRHAAHRVGLVQLRERLLQAAHWHELPRQPLDHLGEVLQGDLDQAALPHALHGVVHRDRDVTLDGIPQHVERDLVPARSQLAVQRVEGVGREVHRLRGGDGLHCIGLVLTPLEHHRIEGVTI